MIWRFTILQYTPDIETVIDEPPGWDTINKTVQRDPETHGIVFNFSESNLVFIEDAFWIIKEEYILNGVDGNVGLRVEWLCDDCDGYQLFYEGKLDFQRYDETCGDDCSIQIGLEASDAETLINNRMDTAVDLTSGVAYDGITTLTDYAGLNKVLAVPSKALLLNAEATTTAIGGDAGYNVISDSDYDYFAASVTQNGYIIPKLNNVVLDEIKNFTPGVVSDYVTDFVSAPILDIQSLGISSGVSNYDVDLRLKGNIRINWAGRFGSTGTSVQVRLKKALKYGSTHIDAFPVDEIGNYTGFKDLHDTSSASGDIPFDIIWAGTIPLDVNDKVWCALPLEIGYLAPSNPYLSVLVTFDTLSYFRVKNRSVVDPSPAKTYLIHETGSRLFENITNDTYRFKSEYYGRTDSQPYAYATDGCGSLRALTNGLQLRRAVLQDNTSPKVFLSPKDFYESLQAIDCIGMGIEGKDVRFEPLEYFYTNEIIFVADGVKEIKTTVRTDRVYNQFNFGYDKFETESTNGLDAIHTKRQYRVPIKNTSSKLEKISKMIADGYAVEVTRRKFGLSEDWRYDQNIFLLCCKRGVLPGEFDVEQNNITGAANLFDPPTVINYAISPIRNAMRWFKWLIQGVRDYANAKILFSSGEGNYVAKGKLSTGCIEEAAVIAENDPIQVSTFDNANDAKPFTVPEKEAFTFPMGLNDFVFVAAKKYGKVQYRRLPTEEWKYGWIDSLQYNPNEGEAEFSLITCKK